MKSPIKTKNFSRFTEKKVFKTILGLSPNFDHKNNVEYSVRKKMKITTRDKIHLKCDCLDGSVMNGFAYVFYL